MEDIEQEILIDRLEFTKIRKEHLMSLEELSEATKKIDPNGFGVSVDTLNSWSSGRQKRASLPKLGPEEAQQRLQEREAAGVAFAANIR